MQKSTNIIAKRIYVASIYKDAFLGAYLVPTVTSFDVVIYTKEFKTLRFTKISDN